jgi:hypothetical protein
VGLLALVASVFGETGKPAVVSASAVRSLVNQCSGLSGTNAISQIFVTGKVRR